MNCSENTRIATQKAKKNRWFRRMFTVALLFGLVVGFIFGRLTALAFDGVKVEPKLDVSEEGVHE